MNYPSLTKVVNDFKMEVTEENVEIDVEVNYRCYMSENKALYPMTVSGSIYKGCNLSEFIEEGKKSYEESYIKVEVVDVFVDL